MVPVTRFEKVSPLVLLLACLKIQSFVEISLIYRVQISFTRLKLCNHLPSPFCFHVAIAFGYIVYIILKVRSMYAISCIVHVCLKPDKAKAGRKCGLRPDIFQKLRGMEES